MSRFLSSIRAIGLFIFSMLIYLIIAMQPQVSEIIGRIPSSLSVSDYLLIGCTLCSILFIVVVIISIPYLRARHKKIYEDPKIMMDVLKSRFESNTVRFLCRIAIWGSIIALISVFVLHIGSLNPFGIVWNSKQVVNSIYLAYLPWAIVMLIPLEIYSVFFGCCVLPRMGEGLYSPFTILIKGIWGDLSFPVIVIKRLINDKKAQYWVGTILMIFYILFIAFNLIAR